MFAYDFSPTFGRRANVDRIFDVLGQTAIDTATSPVYDIIKRGDNEFCITLLAAGLKESQIDIEVRADNLLVEASVDDAISEESTVTYLHRGWAQGRFKQTFKLGEHVQVRSAELRDGLLHIELVRQIPEELVPRKILLKCTDADLAQTRPLPNAAFHLDVPGI